jgi:hypothetical protein
MPLRDWAGRHSSSSSRASFVDILSDLILYHMVYASTSTMSASKGSDSVRGWSSNPRFRSEVLAKRPQPSNPCWQIMERINAVILYNTASKNRRRRLVFFLPRRPRLLGSNPTRSLPARHQTRVWGTTATLRSTTGIILQCSVSISSEEHLKSCLLLKKASRLSHGKARHVHNIVCALSSLES